MKCGLLSVFVFRYRLVLFGDGFFTEFAENGRIRNLEHIVLLRVLCRIAILLPQYAQKLFGGAAVDSAVGDHIAENGNMFGGYSEITVCSRILLIALIKTGKLAGDKLCKLDAILTQRGGGLEIVGYVFFGGELFGGFCVYAP